MSCVSPLREGNIEDSPPLMLPSSLPLPLTTSLSVSLTLRCLSRERRRRRSRYALCYRTYTKFPGSSDHLCLE